MLRAARRNRIRLAAGAANFLHGELPAGTDADVEAGSVQAYIGTGMRDIWMLPTLVIHRVGVIDPVFLHQHTLHSQVGCDRGDLAGLVRLDTADGHQRVATLGERLGNQVLELACLVAAERQAAIAVLALGVELNLAAKLRAQSLQGLMGVGPKVSGWRAKRFRFMAVAYSP